MNGYPFKARHAYTQSAQAVNSGRPRVIFVRRLLTKLINFIESRSGLRNVYQTDFEDQIFSGQRVIGIQGDSCVGDFFYNHRNGLTILLMHR